MSRHHLSRKAFTLTELLAVVLIIIALAALTLGTAKYVIEQGKISQTRVLFAKLETAITAFHLDNGYYPTTSVVRVSYLTYRTGMNSALLYQQLTGGPKKYATFSAQELDTFVLTGSSTSGSVTGQYTVSSGTCIVDPWKRPIVYYCPSPNEPSQPIQTWTAELKDGYGVNYGEWIRDYWTVGGQVNSASFDLFSLGPDRMTYMGGAPWNDPKTAIDDIGNYRR